MKSNEFVLKDSGERREFFTGAVRDKNKDTRYDLLSTLAQRRLCKLLAAGSVKYSENNFRKGIFFSSFIDSAKRHLDKWIDGSCVEEDHLGACLWNIYFLCETEEKVRLGLLPPQLDDLDIYKINKPPIYKPLNLNGNETSTSNTPQTSTEFEISLKSLVDTLQSLLNSKTSIDSNTLVKVPLQTPVDAKKCCNETDVVVTLSTIKEILGTQTPGGVKAMMNHLEMETHLL
jgi:hypothetical protein